MNATKITSDQLCKILNEVAISKDPKQGFPFGNQTLWTVPATFNLSDYDFTNDSWESFSLWATNDDGSKVIRLWSKW